MQHLRTYGHFVKVCLLLTLDASKMVALIVLIKHDIENAVKMAEANDENLSIEPQYLKAIMSICEYSIPIAQDLQTKTPK